MYVVAGHYRESLVTADRGLVDAVLAMVLKVTKARLSCLKMWVSAYKRLLDCHVDPKVREVKQALVPRTMRLTKLRHVTEHAPARQERFCRPKFQLSDKD